MAYDSDGHWTSLVPVVPETNPYEPANFGLAGIGQNPTRGGWVNVLAPSTPADDKGPLTAEDAAPLIQKEIG